MPVVTNRLVNVEPNTIVDISLKAGVWASDGASEVVDEWTVAVAADGTWSINLPSQASWLGNTYYTVREPTAIYAFIVPSTGGPYNLYSLLLTSVFSPPLAGPTYYNSGQMDAFLAARMLIVNAGGAESWDHAGDYADGPLVAMQSGQPWQIYGVLTGNVVDPTALPRYSGGKITYAPAAGGAAYAQYQGQRECTEIVCSFVLGAYSTPNGGAAFGFFDRFVGSILPLAPECPVHLTITALGWEFLVITGNVSTSVASGTFVTPLASDGVTVHTAAIYRDRANSKAYIFLPDGTVKTVTHALIKTLSAKWPFWEPFRLVATDSIASITYASAESKTKNRLQIARTLTLLQSLTLGPPVVVQYSPPSLTSFVLTTTNAILDAVNLAITFTFPPSGRVKIRVSAYLAMLADTLVALTLNASGSLYASYLVTQIKVNQPLSVAQVVTGTPGTVVTLTLGGYAGAAGTAIVQIYGPGGQPALLEAEPL